MGNQKFKSFSLAKGLHDKIQAFIAEHPEYRSMNDLVSESVRLRMFQIHKLEKEKRGGNHE